MIEGNVEQSRERSCTLPLHLGVVAIEKGAFGSPSTTEAYLLHLLRIIMFGLKPYNAYMAIIK